MMYNKAAIKALVGVTILGYGIGEGFNAGFDFKEELDREDESILDESVFDFIKTYGKFMIKPLILDAIGAALVGSSIRDYEEVLCGLRKYIDEKEG